MFRFRIAVLTLFSVVSIGLVASVIAFQYWQTRSAVIDSAGHFMNEVAAKVRERTEGVFGQLRVMAESAVLLPSLSTAPTLHGHPTGPYLINALESSGWAQAAFFGYQNGDFFGIIKFIPETDSSRQHIGAPLGTAFGVRIISKIPGRGDRRWDLWNFLNRSHQIIDSSVALDPVYDPSGGPWFRKAINQPVSVVTSRYRFSASADIGFTIARRFDAAVPGVFGVNWSLSGIASFLREELERQGRATSAMMAMVTGDGRIIATAGKEAPDWRRDIGISDLDDTPLKIAVSKPTSADSNIFTYVDNQYVTISVPLPSLLGDGGRLVYIAPVDEFIGPLLSAVQQSIVFSILLVMLGWLAIYWTSGHVARPVLQLTGEANRLRRFDLRRTPPIRSNIAEISDLARAMRAMRDGLDSFTKYVPRTLVKQIMESGLKPEPGGHRQPLTVLFTDIQNFTPICERLEPEQVIETMCAYLEGMVNVLQQRGATVDKFVGDAIMAYWNAPVQNPNHATDACRAALFCQEWLDADNRIRAVSGDPVLVTRIGIHTGDAIVGHVGSGDRLDYTAMGSTVNTASRLEGLNKFYGTQIIASAAVAKAAEKVFAFRQLDLVLPKGALKPISIFELVGALPGARNIPKSLVADESTIASLSEWNNIISAYQDREFALTLERLDVYAARYGLSPLVTIYRRRSEKFLNTPPPDDWNGAEIFLTKR